METAFVVALVPFEALDTDAETAGFGFFIFFSSSQVLFVGCSCCLTLRIRRPRLFAIDM
jgi:hypothetical protein